MPDGSTEIANARARRVEAIGHLAVTRKVHTLPIGLATRHKLDGRLESPGLARDFGQITMRVPVGSAPSLRHSWFTEIILGAPEGCGDRRRQMPGGDAVSQARLPAIESEAPATSPGFRAIDKTPPISDREPRNPAVRVVFLVNPTNTARVAAFAVNRRRPESF